MASLDVTAFVWFPWSPVDDDVDGDLGSGAVVSFSVAVVFFSERGEPLWIRTNRISY